MNQEKYSLNWDTYSDHLRKTFYELMEVRILTSFGAGDLGSEVDFLYSVMWVTKVTFQTI